MGKEGNMKDLEKFGQNVRDCRKKLGISQEELGFLSGLDRTYISGIERGNRNPSFKNVRKIAKALGVTVGQLSDW